MDWGTWNGGQWEGDEGEGEARKEDRENEHEGTGWKGREVRERWNTDGSNGGGG